MVVVMGVLWLAWALIAKSWQPLAGFLLLVPMCGAYSFLDLWILAQWRSRLITSWIQRELDFNAYRKAMSAHPQLPQPTLQSMLATLPAAGDLAGEHRISSTTRTAAAVAVYRGITGYRLWGVDNRYRAYRGAAYVAVIAWNSLFASVAAYKRMAAVSESAAGASPSYSRTTTVRFQRAGL